MHDLRRTAASGTRSGAELAREIVAAAGALRALGVGPGDRVALVGLNSSRYLSLDTAIGLTGAVSVPLYYTSPLAEIEEILQASGARLLLVGAPDVLARVGELRTRGPDRLLLPRARCRQDWTPGDPPWEAFLALGRKPARRGGSRRARRRLALRAPVGFVRPRHPAVHLRDHRHPEGDRPSGTGRCSGWPRP